MKTSLIENKERHGIELYFESFPYTATRNILKGAGFRWHNMKKCWYAVETPERREIAEKVLKREKDHKIPEPVKAEPEKVVEVVKAEPAAEPEKIPEVVTVYKYGMRLRGFSIGCQPKDGFIERSDDASGRYYDIISYNRPLTSEEVDHFSLDYIPEKPEPVEVAEPEEAEPLSIKYKTAGGHGVMKINMMEFFPCTIKELNILCDTIDYSFEADGHISNIYGYISDKIIEIKRLRDEEDENSAIGKERIAKFNTLLKKYINMAGLLSKRYRLPELTDQAAKISLKAGTVYSMHYMTNYGGDAEIHIHNGWTFEKAGMMFEVFKDDTRKGRYIIQLAGTGSMLATCKNKGAAAVNVTDKIIDTLVKNKEKVDAIKKRFSEEMEKAGFAA